MQSIEQQLTDRANWVDCGAVTRGKRFGGAVGGGNWRAMFKPSIRGGSHLEEEPAGGMVDVRVRGSARAWSTLCRLPDPAPPPLKP